TPSTAALTHGTSDTIRNRDFYRAADPARPAQSPRPARSECVRVRAPLPAALADVRRRHAAPAVPGDSSAGRATGPARARRRRGCDNRWPATTPPAVAVPARPAPDTSTALR